MMKFAYFYAGAALCALATSTAAWGQSEGGDNPLIQDIVVTATKRGGADSVQKVPFAVTAYGTEQLDALNFKGVESLSFSMPNVSLDANNSAPGFANFAIRGQGLGSTIPSLEGAVGVFVDGTYIATNAGVVFDNFDLEGIEVLRGPQGILFGKNVTGGAVLVRTTKPSNELTANARMQIESGPQITANATVSGPLVKDTIQAKLAVYYNWDDGWFTNRYDGSKFGKQRTYIIRPALRITPNDDLEILLRYEHGRITGDGGPGHNFLNGGPNVWDINIDWRGFTNVKWDQAIGEVNLDVGLGDGTVTSIVGWRKLYDNIGTDLDALPQLFFNSEQLIKQNQVSWELRYAGTFGPAKLTTGLYYLDSHLFAIDHRVLAGPSEVAGGGDQQQKTYGAFASVDWSLTDQLILNLGARYNYETKDVSISTIRANGCSVPLASCNYTVFGGDSWKAFTPKVGVQYFADPKTQFYAFWARGFRGGGYNFRNTNPLVPAGPFGNEKQDSFEAGVKSDLADGKIRINASGFYNKIKGAQRAVQTAVPSVGISQVIVNAADATIYGAEGELILAPTSQLTLTGNVGYMHGKYDKILYDLSGNNVLGPEDLALKLIRLPSWTYGGSINYSLPLGDFGKAAARVSYSHRNKNFATENNIAIYPEQDQLDFDISFTPSDTNLTFSFYGKNMLNDIGYGILAPLPYGGSGSQFGDYKKGRVYGGAIRWKY